MLILSNSQQKYLIDYIRKYQSVNYDSFYREFQRQNQSQINLYSNMHNTPKDQFKNKFQKYVQDKLHRQQQKQHFNEELSPGLASPPYLSSPTSVFPFSSLSAPNNVYSRKTICSPPEELQKKFGRKPSEREQMQEESPVKMKRLKKLKELQENQCGICLQSIKKQITLECKHKYCSDCIQDWFKSANKCPFCRAEVHGFWFKGQYVKVQPKELQFDEEEEQEQDSQMDYACYNCQNTQEGDIVLICDRCEVNACHLDCQPSLRGRMPRGDWYCHFCR